MNDTSRQDGPSALAKFDEDAIRAAVIAAIDEEFCGTYGGEGIAECTLAMLREEGRA